MRSSDSRSSGSSSAISAVAAGAAHAARLARREIELGDDAVRFAFGQAQVGVAVEGEREPLLQRRKPGAQPGTGRLQIRRPCR